MNPEQPTIKVIPKDLSFHRQAQWLIRIFAKAGVHLPYDSALWIAKEALYHT